MLVIALTVTAFLSVIDPSRGCASNDKVTALDTVVDQVNTALQAILQNASISTDVKYATILGLVCDNPLLLQAAKDIESQVASCPELVNRTTVGNIQLGPLTFSDLLENFQSLDHFCECKPLLLQVLSVEMIKSELIHSDPSAHYPEIMNMTAVCLMTSPAHHVNLTEVAILVRAHKAACPAVFQYSTINMIRMTDFILKYCEVFRQEHFACALNYTKDSEFNACLQVVDQNITLSAVDELLEASFYRCRRTECVDMYMAECTNTGIVSYMWSVDITHTDKQFQLSNCEPVTGSSSSFYPSFIFIFTIIYVNIVNTIL